LTVEFVKMLRRLDSEITAAEICDVLWLACQIDATEEGENRSITEKPKDLKATEIRKKSMEDGSPQENDKAATQHFPARIYPRARRGPGRADGTGAHPIQSPGVPALPNRLGIARAFRPLKKGIDSRQNFDINVSATADGMADTRIHWPVLRPTKERWLDLALVAESARSMLVWRPVVREFRKLLHRTSLFRKIESWEFSTDKEKGQIFLHRGDGINRPQRSIIGVEGRRVVLVVSDCVSDAWRNGTIARLMEKWTADAMVAVVQLFPEHFWNRTALRQADLVQLRMRSWGAPNRSLLVFPPTNWADITDLTALDGSEWKAPDGPKLPIFPLEPPYIRAWAASLAALRHFDLPGVILDKKASPANSKTDSEVDLSAETLVDRFTAVASPKAKRLAAYLAAAPLVMPVMRLVQAAMLPDSHQSHLAEVMLSGLIRRVTPESSGAAEDEILYDFVDGVRGLLLAMNRISDSVRVLELAMGKMSDFINARTGRTVVSFRALLADPTSIGQFQLEGTSRAFAEISVFVLKRLGGVYIEIAERLENEIVEKNTEIKIDILSYHGDILEIQLGNSKTIMRFIYIEPGEFLMGSPQDEPGRFDREKQHKVMLTEGFYMQETPVTQGQWKAVMGNNPSHFRDEGPEHPVERVSWEDAQEFILRLNRKTENIEYRLPTEAQWEYVCRAETDSPFWTGQCLSTDEANYDGNNPQKKCPKGIYRKQTTPVKKFSPNQWGLYDMHGNVWEWCSDLFGDYSKGTVTDPKGPDKGPGRVYRGGAWFYGADSCRSASRNYFPPNSRNNDLGFRVLAYSQRAMNLKPK